MSIYRGMRTQQGCVVTRDGVVLSPGPSQAIRNHSPTGYSWGYGGSGPAQLALALLLDVLGRAVAERMYQDFKWRVIAGLGDDWELDSEFVRSWCTVNMTHEQAMDIEAEKAWHAELERMNEEAQALVQGEPS